MPVLVLHICLDHDGCGRRCSLLLSWGACCVGPWLLLPLMFVVVVLVVVLVVDVVVVHVDVVAGLGDVGDTNLSYSHDPMPDWTRFFMAQTRT